MRKYFCDVCGKEFDHAAVDPDEVYDAKAACPAVTDVCPECSARGRAMDVGDLILAAWRCGLQADPGSLPVQETAGSVPGTPPAPETVQEAAQAPQDGVQAHEGEMAQGVQAAVQEPPEGLQDGPADDGADAAQETAQRRAPDGSRDSLEQVPETAPAEQPDTAGPEPPGNVPAGVGPESCDGDAPAPLVPGTSPEPQDPERAVNGTSSDGAPSVTGTVHDITEEALKSAAAGPLSGPGWKPIDAFSTKKQRGRGAASGAKPARQAPGTAKSGGPGSHWAEKRETMERLQAFRKDGGTTHEVADAAGLPSDTIRSMLEAKQRPIDEWRAVKKALDKLEGKSAPEDGPET